MFKNILLLLLFFAAVVQTDFNNHAHAVIETVQFDSPELEQRYKDLIAELRCLVCQNQNLADSDADLAKDLRRKTAEMLRAGKSDKEIQEYMRDRYGDFVLYNPPFEGMTILLWIAPVALLIIVLVGVVITIKRRQSDELLEPAKTRDQKALTKVRNIMRDSPNLAEPNKD